jgi:hypothetical protein
VKFFEDIQAGPLILPLFLTQVSLLLSDDLTVDFSFLNRIEPKKK